MKKSNFKIRLMTVLSMLSLMLFSHCAMQDAEDLNSKLSDLQKGELAIEENGGENLRKNAQNPLPSLKFQHFLCKIIVSP